MIGTQEHITLPALPSKQAWTAIKMDHDHSHSHSDKKESRFDAFFFIALIAQAGFAILYGVFTEYGPDAYGASGQTNVNRYMAFYSDVTSMIFLGFGFLMTFMWKHSYGAIVYVFMTSVFCVQWAILVMGFCHRVSTGYWVTKIALNMYNLIHGQFAAGSVMIALGGVIGKVTKQSMLLIAFFQVIFYSINFTILEEYFHVIDIGGSLSIHAFGAYFGLTCAAVLSPKVTPTNSHLYEKGVQATYTSDLFSFLGTLLLWVYWPSFNAAIAADGQLVAVINTLLAMCACAFTTHVMSRFFRGGNKMHMVDLQNATVAGGVAAGATANTLIGPGVAIAIGMGAGVLSTWGFCILMPRLEKLGLRDTCGINNLHGMPGIYAGIISSIAFKVMYDVNAYGSNYSQMFPKGASQGGYQMAGLVVTLGIAVVGGFLTAMFVKLVTKAPGKMFTDSEHYHMPEDFLDIDHKHHLEVDTMSPVFPNERERELDDLHGTPASRMDMLSSEERNEGLQPV